MLLDRNEMQPATTELQVVLIVAKHTWVDLILIENALILISHDTKQLVIHCRLM